MSPVDLVFWYPGVNPYLADRFTALAESGRVNFECWFTRGIDPTRSWEVDLSSLNFPYRFVPNIKLGTLRTGMPIAHFVDTRPRILISFYADPLVAGSVFQHLLPDAKLLYYVEKTFDTWFKRTPFKEFTKRRLLRLADGFLTPGEDADNYVRDYAKSTAPILRLNHVVNVNHFALARSLRGSHEFETRRNKLGLSGFVFLYVGRIWSQKGIDTLISAFAQLRGSGINASLLLVGDGVDRGRYEDQIKRSGLDHVVFLDFVQQVTLPQIYALADAFVFPTRGDPYGLVVDEAMASGLPIISTVAAGEIRSRVIENKTGYLVPPDSPEHLVSAMLALTEHPHQAHTFGDHAFQAVKHRTPDHWAKQIEGHVESLLRGELT